MYDYVLYLFCSTSNDSLFQIKLKKLNVQIIRVRVHLTEYLVQRVEAVAVMSRERQAILHQQFLFPPCLV